MPRDSFRNQKLFGRPTELHVSGVSLAVAGGDTLIRNLTFSVAPGQILGLIGDEGAGKSTLLAALAGERRSGVTIDGQWFTPQPGYLPQVLDPTWNKTDAYEYFFKSRPSDEVDSGIWNHYSSVVAALAQVGLDADQFLGTGRTLDSLSGGELTRLRIGKLLYNQCSTLLLDEPTNHLDLSGILWLERFLGDFTGPVMTVSHDEAFLENCATDILYIQRAAPGREPLHRLNGNGYEAFRVGYESEVNRSQGALEKFQQEQRSLKTRLNEERNSAEAQHRREQPQNGAEKSRQMRGFARATRHRSLLEGRIEAAQAPQAFRLDDAIQIAAPEGCAIPAGRVVFDMSLPKLEIDGNVLALDVKLQIVGPEKIVIVGQNGSGKSTLIQCLYEQLTTAPSTAMRVGYLPQNYFTRIRQVQDSPIGYLSGAHTSEREVRTLLAQLNLDADHAKRELSQLSGGQLAKVLIADLVLRRANLLLLDEPTNNLYPLSSRELRRYLKDFPGAVVAISHDRAFIDDVATRVLEFSRQNGLRPISSMTARMLGE